MPVGLPDEELLDELEDEDEDELLEDELLDEELDDDELLEEEELLLDELELLDELVPELEPEEAACPPQPATSIAASARGNSFVVIGNHPNYWTLCMCARLANLSMTSGVILKRN